MKTESPISVLTVNAFTTLPFGGNPAAVILTEHALPDSLMQSIAAQHNLSETAFLVKTAADRFNLRWFTPTKEVRLCGHATLASAFALDYIGAWRGDTLTFDTASGALSVRRDDEMLRIEFPAIFMNPIETPKEVAKALGVEIVRSFVPASDAWQMVCEVASEEQLVSCQPHFEALASATSMGVSITAEGSNADYVSRFFIPQLGINEDPVTGSAHCHLVPLWSERLSKKHLKAEQLSPRGGSLLGELMGDRVLLSGSCTLFAEGSIFLPRQTP